MTVHDRIPAIGQHLYYGDIILRYQFVKRIRSKVNRLFKRRPFKYLKDAKNAVFGKYDIYEVANLDHSLAKLIAPRLRAFQQMHMSHPSTLTADQWDRIVGRMARAFELLADDDTVFDADMSEQTRREIDEGLYLFYKYYHDLWS